jgi:5-methylcytosine-specific restriction endonuclease McrA
VSKEISPEKKKKMNRMRTLRQKARKKMLKQEDKPRICACCGQSGKTITVDHVVPLTRGGANDVSNFQFLCFRCNADKANLTNEEYLQLLIERAQRVNRMSS